jgi:hypothetical protein
MLNNRLYNSQGQEIVAVVVRGENPKKISQDIYQLKKQNILDLQFGWFLILWANLCIFQNNEFFLFEKLHIFGILIFLY